jgi:hypothetical protein
MEAIDHFAAALGGGHGNGIETNGLHLPPTATLRFGLSPRIDLTESCLSALNFVRYRGNPLLV